MAEKNLDAAVLMGSHPFESLSSNFLI